VICSLFCKGETTESAVPAEAQILQLTPRETDGEVTYGWRTSR